MYMDIPQWFTAINYFCDFLFAYLNDKGFPNGHFFYMDKICPFGEQTFHLQEALYEMGDHSTSHRIVSMSLRSQSAKNNDS